MHVWMLCVALATARIYHVLLSAPAWRRSCDVLRSQSESLRGPVETATTAKNPVRAAGRRLSVCQHREPGSIQIASDASSGQRLHPSSWPLGRRLRRHRGQGCRKSGEASTSELLAVTETSSRKWGSGAARRTLGRGDEAPGMGPAWESQLRSNTAAQRVFESAQGGQRLLAAGAVGNVVVCRCHSRRRGWLVAMQSFDGLSVRGTCILASTVKT
ncbi:hypothetical protein LX32DRAFT_857 [Colletotrichum zoysiae]|uniref:Secreted protein n=1 Tax=Colletotrichum zoysiae TaxID=1216348 RepID=A0AAD9HWL6_9PEZI|nr:hypothetical protein LX32DRAFT_857 [Colletotrichum zoysiae]